jgi:hypothetical protein
MVIDSRFEWASRGIFACRSFRRLFSRKELLEDFAGYSGTFVRAFVELRTRVFVLDPEQMKKKAVLNPQLGKNTNPQPRNDIAWNHTANAEEMA